MTNILIIGASRGLGQAFAEGLGEEEDNLYLVSRTQSDIKSPAHVQWIDVDVSQTTELEKINHAIQDQPIDLFIYNAGIWEADGFDVLPDAEIERILQVNTISPLIITKNILNNLKKSTNPLAVFIGSTAGLENKKGKWVAYGASKAGLRGAVHSIREVVRKDKIRTTCINPGGIATDVPLHEGTAAALKRHDGEKIPMGDIVQLVKTLYALSPATCVKEIHMPALLDEDV